MTEKLKIKGFSKWILLLLLVVLIILPIVLVLINSIYVNGELDILGPLNVFREDDLLKVFFNTMKLGFWVVILSTIIALPLAFLTSKTFLKKYRLIDIILLIPFMTPPYIGSMGWILFMQKNGYLVQIFKNLDFLTESFFTFKGLVFIMSLHLFPFLYLVLKNTFLEISGALEEAGEVHGGSFTYRLRRIICPLLFSSYGVGALLIFVKATAEFGGPATFGRQIGYTVMTTEIHKYISSWPISFSKATALSSVLLSTCLLIWCLQNIFSKKHSYVIVSGKSKSIKEYNLSRVGKVFSSLYLTFIIVISIGVPYFSIIISSLIKVRGIGIKWGNYTLDGYKGLFSNGSDGLEALVNSLSIGIISAIIATIIGTICGIVIGKRKKCIENKLIGFTTILPNTIPSIVIVFGLILLWNNKNLPFTIYNTFGMVVLTHVALFLPYTVQYVQNSYSQLGNSLIEAGKIFGGNNIFILRKIVIPKIIPSILAGFTMTFIISTRELVASLMVLPPGMKNSASYIFLQFEQGNVQAGMAMAVVTVFFTTLVLILLNIYKDREARTIQ